MGPSYAVLLMLFGCCCCCDLQLFFTDRRVSVEESSLVAQLVFKGLLVSATRTSQDAFDLVLHFQLLNTYKGAGTLMLIGSNVFR